MLLGLVAAPGPAAAQDRVIVYPRRSEAVLDPRDAYPVGLLQIALERAGIRARVTPSDVVIEQPRAFRLMQAGLGIDLVFAAGGPGHEGAGRLIPVPLTRGLLGHRLMLIDRDRQGVLDAVRTIEDLRRFTFAQGTGWPDIAVLEAAGLIVSTARYDLLFRLVATGRADLFPRGVHEAFAEIALRLPENPSLAVEQRMVLVYDRYDVFFFVRRSEEALAAAIEAGLRRAYDDGAFMAHFRGHPTMRDALAQARLAERRRIVISNPLLTDAVDAIPQRFWESP
ncbi:MAG: hypothetical protein JNK11_01290 [Alphaproteobacteria bacterium]|nr:hypothetical protein [Alphaproteobacteria bacterium]